MALLRPYWRALRVSIASAAALASPAYRAVPEKAPRVWVAVVVPLGLGPPAVAPKGTVLWASALAAAADTAKMDTTGGGRRRGGAKTWARIRTQEGSVPMLAAFVRGTGSVPTALWATRTVMVTVAVAVTVTPSQQNVRHSNYA